MSALSAALESLDIPTLTSLCEQSELSAATKDLPHPHATLHLLTLLLQDDLTEARFLWRRLSASAKSPPDTAAAWALGRALWTSNWNDFYGVAMKSAWGDAARLVTALVDETRRKRISVIARSYSCIRAERMSYLLGMDATSVQSVCEKHGWKLVDNFVLISEQDQSKYRSREKSQFEELQVLTEQLVRLQTTG